MSKVIIKLPFKVPTRQSLRHPVVPNLSTSNIDLGYVMGFIGVAVGLIVGTLIFSEASSAVDSNI